MRSARHFFLLFCIIGLCSCKGGKAVAEFEGGALFEDNGVRVACLYGSWEQMGRQYGALLSSSISGVLEFVDAKTLSGGVRSPGFEQMVEDVYSQYPEYLRTFVEGAAQTSGISLERLKEANAVEYGEGSFHCSAFAAWGDYANGPLVFGRNYDAISFAPIGNELLVTVFHPSDGAQSFATVGYAGEIYCLNGFNESGLFVELNNGCPSAGFNVDFSRPLGTTELMRLIAEARSLEDADAFFAHAHTACGFIIGVSDGSAARSYEWFQSESHRGDGSTPKGLMVMTNHYVSPEWSFAAPNEETSWRSHARRNNMLKFAEEHKGRIDADALRTFMRVPIAEGGPAIVDWDMYQIVAVPGEKRFYLNIPGTDVQWAEIKLGKYL